jgi:uncharacterized cupin superfamily protein
MTTPRKATLLRAAEIAAAAHEFSHPWNPDSRLVFAMLGRRAGLERTGLNLARMPPGKESFAYHRHHCEEEWIYIIEGRAVAEIDGEHHELGPGDFVAFPTPSVPHQLRNPFDRECVYLMGGESRPVEIGDFPRLGRRMVRINGQETTYDLSAERPVFEPEPPDTLEE